MHPAHKVAMPQSTLRHYWEYDRNRHIVYNNQLQLYITHPKNRIFRRYQCTQSHTDPYPSPYGPTHHPETSHHSWSQHPRPSPRRGKKTARRRGRAWELRRAGRAGRANEKKHGIVRRPDSVEAAEACEGRKRDPLYTLLGE